MPETEFLAKMVIALGAAMAAAWVLRALRAPAFMGYLLAGILVGPHGLNWIAVDDVTQFAEVGLILLLFSVGLEFSPEPLLRQGGRLLLAALLQMGSITAATMGVLYLVCPAPLIRLALLGLAVALSSTAIVLKQLSEQREIDTGAGSVTVGILLLQDISVILVLLFLPLLSAEGTAGAGKSGSTDSGSAAVNAILAVAGLAMFTILARLLLPAFVGRFFRRSGSEFSTLFAVVAAAAGAWATASVGWSPALGAFIVGLVLAFTDMRHQLFAEISPFRDMFYALFFVSVGMLLNLGFVARHANWIIGSVIAVLAVKTVLTSVSVRLAGWPLRLSLQAGLGLCTISEFSYVLAVNAQRVNLIPGEAMEFLTACIVGSMLAGAVFVLFAGRGALLISRLLRPGQPEKDSAEEKGQATLLSGHVVIVGYGLNGENLARALSATRIPYCVIEFNRRLARRAIESGGSVVVGDATRPHILEHAGVARARALVVCIDDRQATRRIVAQARRLRTEMFILARTRYVAEVDALYRLGADRVIPEEFETSVEVFSHVLREFGVPDNVIGRQIDHVRAGGYAMLRGIAGYIPARAEWSKVLGEAATRTLLIEPGSPAIGRSIKEIDFRARTGATILAVVRDGQALANPSAEMQLAEQDVLVLVGSSESLKLAESELTGSRQHGA